MEALLAHLAPDDRLDQPLPPRARIGHVHLYVHDVPEAMKFYTDVTQLPTTAAIDSLPGFNGHRSQ